MLPNTFTQAHSAAPFSILVVSHEEATLNKIRACFTNSPHFLVSFAKSAKSALQMLRHQHIDILIGDLEISDLDGWRLSRLVRSGVLKCNANIPIVMMSATWCERIAEVTAREYGVNQLLPLEHVDRLQDIVKEFYDNKITALPKPRLLVVEDQHDTADLIIRILENAFSIDVAEDGLEGLNAWRKSRHDLILLDIMLPTLSGRDVLIEIMKENPEQTVVIMTAHSSIDQAEELMMLGASDFLPKPFRAEQLRKVSNIASLREDYLVSNAQFAARVESLREREFAYKKLYERHHRLLDDLQSVVMELDDKLNIRFLNRTWEALMGFTIEESLGRPIEHFISNEHYTNFPRFKNKLKEALFRKQSTCEMELCFLSKKNKKIWTELKVSHSTTIDSSAALTICLDNITDRIKAQKKLEHLAMHDALTGLYNRHFFENSLEKLAADALRSNRNHGLVYIDLDYFKIINDTFGHQKGDEVLQEVSSLLKQRLRHSDLLCRLGGDEFAILLNDVSEQRIKHLAEEIKQTIASCSFQLQDQIIYLGASIGLACINGSVKYAEEYLMQADIALYVAKDRGRNMIHLYDPEDQESEEMRHNINWSQKIREAIATNRLLLYFQPVFDVNRNEISYYEALVRYSDGQGNIEGPNTFIPALESTGEMQMLDRKVIELAINVLKNYPQLKHIAINLSAQAFKDENLVPSLITNLTQAGVNPGRLTFELTESASLFNLNVTQRVIRSLHELGCNFSVDDFGSGFSSFSYLKQLPADYIKLDGSFIQNLHNDPVDQALVKSIIQVIQALGKKAVAEYVENEEILRMLKEMGIDFVQGYHIGHPQPIEKIFYSDYYSGD